MTDTPEPLDPDQVACPRCGAAPGEVCRYPSGAKAHKIHDARRAAVVGTDKVAAENTAKRRRAGSKGARAKNARQRKDRDTVAAIVGARRAEALIEEAERLGFEAVEVDKRRMALRRLALDNALRAGARLAMILDDYREVATDDLGRPLRIPIEKTRTETDDRGREILIREVEEELDRRGIYGPDDAKALSTVFGTMIDKVRLEEGSATSRTELAGLGSTDDLRDLSDDELRAFSDRARAAIDAIRPPDAPP